MSQSQLPTAFAPAERADEQELKAQVQDFIDEGMVKQLLDAVPDIFLILNEKRQIVFTNKALLNLLGYDCFEKVCGLRPGEAIDCLHAGETEGGCGTTEFCSTCGAVSAIQSSLCGNESVQECHVLRKNGDALDLQVWATPLVIGSRKYSMFAMKDISHEKRRRALERIFFHDILNTVGGVQGFAEMLREAGAEELDELEAQIITLTHRLIDEIYAQRELASAEANELAVHPERIESMSVIEELLMLYSNHEVAEKRVLAIEMGTEDIRFKSDPTLLRRVLGNMLKNALEACPIGGKVTIGCSQIDKFVEFRVHNPAFIPREVQLQIFMRSFSTKGKSRGLGTYSMKLLSERYLKGSVDFVTSESDGTTFMARFPLTL